MKITSELLKKFNACEDGIRFIEKEYPNGVEIADMDDEVIAALPSDYWHFARRYFITTPEEIEKYNRACNITNSSTIVMSDNVHNSKKIVDSSNINLSEYVFNSIDIEESNYVYNSNNIQDCNDIVDGEYIRVSDSIINCKKVGFSRQLIDSSFFEWSNNVLFSFNINSSEFIYNSESLVDCYFCGFLKNCKHCLFCTGLENKEYYIFNKEVSANRFEEIKEQLILQLQAEQPTFVCINENEKVYRDKRFIYNRRLDSVFNGLSDEFYNWVCSLYEFWAPVYSELFFEEP